MPGFDAASPDRWSKSCTIKHPFQLCVRPQGAYADGRISRRRPLQPSTQGVIAGEVPDFAEVEIGGIGSGEGLEAVPAFGGEFDGDGRSAVELEEAVRKVAVDAPLSSQMSETGNQRTRRERRRATPGRKVSIERLEAALLKVAYLVAHDPAFTPIFERLEAELDLARKEVEAMTGAQQRAKSLLDQKARPARSEAFRVKDAPLP